MRFTRSESNAKMAPSLFLFLCLGFVVTISIAGNLKAKALAVPFQPQSDQGQSHRPQVGVECEQTADCFGGECRSLETTGSGRKSCMCLDGTFRYVIAPALQICLKCRELNALCSFDQECQCADKNAICDIQAFSGKGRCKCRANYLPFFEPRSKSVGRGNFTCRTGGVKSICTSDRDCASIKFADSEGKLLGSRDGTGRRKSDIEAKCELDRTSSASTPTPIGIMGQEELDLFDTSNTSLLQATPTAAAAAANATLLTPLDQQVLPEPRGANTTSEQRSCRCPDGFTGSPTDNYVCQDVDECSFEVDPCNPVRLADAKTTCVNTIGSFRCECNSTMALGQGLPSGSGICCNEGHLPCLDSSRCIPLNKLCDGLPDCETDCSDELYPFCNFNNYRSFPDFSQFPQCHEGFVQDDIIGNSQMTVNPINKYPAQENYEDLLPLGANTPGKDRPVATPPSPLPTLPANMTAARLLGYVLV